MSNEFKQAVYEGEIIDKDFESLEKQEPVEIQGRNLSDPRLAIKERLGTDDLDIIEGSQQISYNHGEAIRLDDLKEKQLVERIKNKEFQLEKVEQEDLVKNPRLLRKVSKKDKLIKQQAKHNTNKKLREESKDIVKEYLD